MWWALAIGAGAAVAWYLLRGECTSYDSARAFAVEGADQRGHARRTAEGYLLSGRFDASNVPVIVQQGIKLIIGAEEMEQSTHAALDRHGIAYLPAYLSDTWLHGAEIRRAASEYDPDEIMIHCEHGVDRTGNIMAHLLVTRHCWDIADALFAVVSPSPAEVEALNDLLGTNRDPRDPRVGVYSLRCTGKGGGMKVAGSGYRNLILTNIEDMRRAP